MNLYATVMLWNGWSSCFMHLFANFFPSRRVCSFETRLSTSAPRNIKTSRSAKRLFLVPTGERSALPVYDSGECNGDVNTSSLHVARILQLNRLTMGVKPLSRIVVHYPVYLAVRTLLFFNYSLPILSFETRLNSINSERHP